MGVVGANGQLFGVWTFNLYFDANVHAHTAESLAFLQRAGINFPRHAAEGIDVLALGQRLAVSSLVGPHGRTPCWLTFSGSYDWAYLLKMITLGRALPSLPNTFDKVLSYYCPKRYELRDLLPSGSLEVLGQSHGVKRWGCAHTAGSDALLTAELFVLHGGLAWEQDDVRNRRESQREHWARRLGKAMQNGTQLKQTSGIMKPPPPWTQAPSDHPTIGTAAPGLPTTTPAAAGSPLRSCHQNHKHGTLLAFIHGLLPCEATELSIGCHKQWE